MSYRSLAQSSFGKSSGGVFVPFFSLVAVPGRLLWAVTAGYPATQGTLALPAIPWLKVAGATYSKISNYDLVFHKMFYNYLSTLGPVGPVGPVRPTKGPRTTKGNVVD